MRCLIFRFKVGVVNCSKLRTVIGDRVKSLLVRVQGASCTLKISSFLATYVQGWASGSQ